MNIPTLTLTTGQKMAQDITKDLATLRQYIQSSCQSYAQFWGNDQAETIAALNADKAGYLSLLSAHHALYTAVNTAAIVAGITEQVPTALPVWVMYNKTEFVAVETS